MLFLRKNTPARGRGGGLKTLGFTEGFDESLEAGDGESAAEAADETGRHGNRVGQVGLEVGEIPADEGGDKEEGELAEVTLLGRGEILHANQSFRV